MSRPLGKGTVHGGWEIDRLLLEQSIEDAFVPAELADLSDWA
jgi:hypothetical protein